MRVGSSEAVSLFCSLASDHKVANDQLPCQNVNRYKIISTNGNYILPVLYQNVRASLKKKKKCVNYIMVYFHTEALLKEENILLGLLIISSGFLWWILKSVFCWPLFLWCCLIHRVLRGTKRVKGGPHLPVFILICGRYKITLISVIIDF